MKRILPTSLCMVAVLAFMSCANGSSDTTGTSSSGSTTTTTTASSTSGTSKTVTISNAGKSVTYSGVLVVDGTTESYSGQTYASTASNQTAILVINGGNLTLTGCTITKSGDGSSSSSGTSADDSFNFYGLNSAVVAVGSGSTITLDNCTVSTAAKYANAVFSCDGASIAVRDGLTITTTKDSSRGLYATYAGTITSSATGAVSITTSGAHCAALATDRGGGTVTVTGSSTYGCTLSTAGDGSPCIYSTGTISASYMTGTSTGAQALVVEGLNSITLDACSVSGKDASYGGIMLYQSTSGDAATGTASLTMTDTTIQDNGGKAMFFITNTDAKVTVTNCTFKDSAGTAYSSSNASNALILCEATSRWGSSGSNGGDVTFAAYNQNLYGTICASASDSSVTLTYDSRSAYGCTKASGSGTVTVNDTTI
jgi:hypothetical protein